MMIKAANVVINRTNIAVCLVESSATAPATDEGDRILRLLQPFFPTLPIMLVSVQDNGFRSYATFQSSTLLSLAQFLNIPWQEYNLSIPPPPVDLPHPF